MSAMTAQQQVLWARHIEGLAQAARGKKVVVVEGDDDRSFLEGVLNRVMHRRWQARIAVVVAEGRGRVLDWTGPQGYFAGHFGLVDRDTWTNAEVRAHQHDRPFLFVTSGWCLENLVLERAALGELGAPLAQVLHDALPAWRAAGARWWVLHRWRSALAPWWSRLGAYGAPSPAVQALDEARLRADLFGDVQRADLIALVAQWTQREQALVALPPAEQWRSGIHGKAALQALLAPTLSQRWPGQDRSQALGASLELGDDPALSGLLALLRS